MSLIITAGVLIVTTVGVGYAGKKGWHAFHRAVGITPGTMRYSDAPALEPPKLIQLNIDTAWLPHLPIEALTILKRIDDKADIYQRWRDELAAQGRVLPSSEAQFVVGKLLDERLPQMLADYHALAQYQHQLANIQVQAAAPPNADATLTAAYELLIELLTTTEAKLDGLLTNCGESHYHDLKVMRRYLDKLD